jgi:hypothetical protein
VPGAKHFVDLEGKTTIAGVKMTAAKIMSQQPDDLLPFRNFTFLLTSIFNGGG